MRNLLAGYGDVADSQFCRHSARRSGSTHLRMRPSSQAKFVVPRYGVEGCAVASVKNRASTDSAENSFARCVAFLA